MKTNKFFIFVFFVFQFSFCCFAAKSYTESFNGEVDVLKIKSYSSNKSHWSGRGTVSVLELYGRFEAKFSKQNIVPIPETGSMVATNGASNGAFEGDFIEADLHEIGFKFLAEDVKPSSAILRIFAGKRAYIHTLDLSSLKIGKWTEYKFSIDNLSENGWNGGDSTEERFKKDLKNVTCIEVQISRRGSKEQKYSIDDFYVSSTPIPYELIETNDEHLIDILNPNAKEGVWASNIKIQNETVEIKWCNLVPTMRYSVEYITSLNNDNICWMELEQFTASGIDMNISHKFENIRSFNNLFFRLKEIGFLKREEHD